VQPDLVGLAFTAGLVAALNPCGFALLPAYLTLVVRNEGTSIGAGDTTRLRETLGGGGLAALGRALAATMAMALGFLAIFGTFGLLAVSVASTVQRYIPYITVLIGIVLVAVGAWPLAGRGLAVANPILRSRRLAPTARIASMFVYGVGYAIASLSCTVGPFLAVVAASLRSGTLLDGVFVYLAYGAGMTLIVAVLAIAVALLRSTLIERMRRAVRYINWISAVLLVVAGLYVGYYGIYEVRLFNASAGPNDPVIAAVGSLLGIFPEWVHRHGAWPWLLAGAIFAALATLVSAWHWQRRWRFRRCRAHDMSPGAREHPGTPSTPSRAPR
jgi:cytochrome c biogenesis protein CcdA